MSERERERKNRRKRKDIILKKKVVVGWKKIDSLSHLYIFFQVSSLHTNQKKDYKLETK